MLYLCFDVTRVIVQVDDVGSGHRLIQFVPQQIGVFRARLEHEERRNIG